MIVWSVLTRMCPIQSGINTRTLHSIQFWIDIRIDLWMCNIVNANSLSWMGIHRVGENNPIQFTFTNWLPSFQIKSWMGMRVCANGIRIGHNSARCTQVGFNIISVQLRQTLKKQLLQYYCTVTDNKCRPHRHISVCYVSEPYGSKNECISKLTYMHVLIRYAVSYVKHR